MKRIIALLFCLPLLCMSAAAAEETEPYDIASQWEASGISRLYRELPEETAADLRDAGIDSTDYRSVTAIHTGQALDSLWHITRREAETPLAALGFIMAILLLASLYKGGEESLRSPLASSAGTLVSAAVSLTVAAPVAELIGQIGDTVQIACVFTEAFAAVFLGILIAGGQTVWASGYGSFVFGAVEVASVGVGEIIVPMLKIFLALSCTAAISENIRLDAVTAFFEKNAKWLLGFLAAMISSILALSGVMAASADSLAARTAKFVIAGSVPVVGGAVGDAYLTVKSGMQLLRQSAGAFGIIAVAYLYLPLLIRTFLWKFVMECGVYLCEAFQLNSIIKLMKSLAATLSLMLGVQVFSLFLLTLGSVLAVMMRQGI